MELQNDTYDAVIIGAGQSGLATAYYLQQAGLSFVVLESAETIGGAWRQYYDSLKLFSPNEYSSLPGLVIEGDLKQYPKRDDIVNYLESYANHYDFPILKGANVVSLSKQLDNRLENFLINFANGQSITSQTVIVATGSFKNPYYPKLLGQEQFHGKTLHAAEYVKPTPFVGQRLIVVGGRNTAVQIATELAEVATVTVASKEAISFVPQNILGKDVHFWLTKLGIDQLPIGQWFNLLPKESVVDDGQYKAALNLKQPNRKPMFEMFKKDGVVWDDGIFEKVDTVIFATGYRPNLPFLHKIENLDGINYPSQKGGVSTAADGLYFVGLPWQRSHRSATLRGVGPDAKFIVDRLQVFLTSI